LCISNSMVSEAPLPDFAVAANHRSQGMRISALNQLDSVFERHIVGGSQYQVYVFWHDNKTMQLESAFAAISINSLQEKPPIVLDNEQPSSLPRRESYEISSGRRDHSSRLQEQTPAAKAAIAA
jgi:hypothetical protein